MLSLFCMLNGFGADFGSSFFNKDNWGIATGLGSLLAAVVTLILYIKAESRNRPRIVGEVEMDGAIVDRLDDLSVPKVGRFLMRAKLTLWNEGNVDSAYRAIHLLDKANDRVLIEKIKYGVSSQSSPIPAGQIIHYSFWIDLGDAPQDILYGRAVEVGRDDLRTILSVETQDKFQDMKVLVELTNYPDLICNLPDPFAAAPKAVPAYPKYQRFPFRKVNRSDFLM